MLTERRRRAFTPAFLSRVAIAWIAISAVLVAIRWSALSSGQFPDSDDIMRLIQVRDLLAGQSWFDVTQYRVDAVNGGVPMHWSRIVDIPIVLTILALTPFVGAASAETAALVIVPLLTLGLTLLLCARIAWRLLGDEVTTLTILVMAISLPILFKFGPMRIDHHGWQIVCALVAVNGLTARSDKVAGRMIGASLAVWLAISIEGLPVAAMFFAVLGLRWLQRHGDHVALVSAIRTLAVTSAALFVATRGIFDYATYCDAISPLHIAMFGWAAMVLTTTSRIRPIGPGLIWGGMIVAAGGAGAMLLTAAPQCVTGGGFAQLDPLVAYYWHSNVLEGMPIWRQEPDIALRFMVGPLIGLIAAVNLIGQSRDWTRRFWREYALILMASVLVSVFIARAGSLACALAAPPLAWQLRVWLLSFRSSRRPVSRVTAMAGLAIALIPTLPLIVLTKAMPAEASGGEPQDAGALASYRPDCRVERAAEVLEPLAPGEVFASFELSPYLLFADHTVVATSHHRGNEGMRFLIATSLGSSDAARKALVERGTEYVALCPEQAEARLYSKAAPDGFVAALRGDTVPDWLEPLPVRNGSTLRLWRVRSE